MLPADLRQAGIVDLLVAADRFDPERGVPFRAYARLWVRKEIQRAIAEQDPDDEFDDCGLPGVADPEHAAVITSTMGALSRALATLDAQTARAFILYTGLVGRDPRSLRQVGRLLGCSAHTARDLLEKARTHLRAAVGRP